jgi:hypothetical protein
MLVATGATLTPADIGLTVTGIGLPDATTIVQVIDATHAVLSAKATAAVSSVDLAAPRVVSGVSVTQGSATVTKAGAFTAADTGRTITGTGIAPGTTIKSVAADTNSVTLTAPATANGTSVTIGNPAVPSGAYTITVVSNGANGASPTNDPNYSQSVISSGSTFTVADY